MNEFLKTNSVKAEAVVIIALMLTVCFAPTVYASEDDGMETYRQYTMEELREIIYDTDPSEYPEYGIAPIIIAIALGITAVVSFFAGVHVGSQVAENTYDDTKLNQQFSMMEAQVVESATNTATHLITSILPQDADLWFFTTDYWQKIMEYMVYDEWTTDNEGFDANSRNLMYNTGLITNAANYIYTWSNSMDTAYNHILDRTSLWTGGDGLEYTDSMRINIEWSGGSITGTNGQSASTINLDFAQTITVDKPTVVYIDMETDNPGFTDRNSGMMYNFSGGDRQIVKMDSPNAGTSKVLKAGMNDITDIPSGIYLLPAGTYAGPMVSMIGESSTQYDSYPAGMVQACLVMVDDGTPYLVTTNGVEGNSLYRIANSNGNTVANTASLKITVDQFGGDKTECILLGDEDGTYLDVLYGYDSLISQINRVIEQTYNAGKSTWTIFDACESSNSSIHPSSIVVNVPGRDLTAEEYLTLYLNAMAQIHEYAETHSNDLDGIAITMDPNSLDLVCYGTIYANGESVARNVIFSPYCYTVDQTLSVGENIFEGTGSAIIWGITDSVEDFQDWNQQMYLDSATAIGLENGYVVEIEAMIYNGEDTDSFTFERNEIQAGGTGSSDDNTPDDIGKVPDPVSLAIYYCLILVGFGLAAIMAGRAYGLGILIIVGLVVIAIGVMIPEAIWGLCTGNFDWSQMVPFSWI